VFAGDPATADLNRRLVGEVRERGGRAVLVGMTGEDGVAPGPFCLPSGPARLRPLLEILPVQMITLALAQLHGREAGALGGFPKVTTSE
jgi:glutamine---fructose-6-phosphate transaminase (isomerizing)